MQVVRLAARMRGLAAPSPGDELAALLERWSALGQVDDEVLVARFERALGAALETLP